MSEALIPVVGMLIPIVIVPTALVTKYLRHRRDLEHAERMRALEVGQPLNQGRRPSRFGDLTTRQIALAIGAGVPVGGMALALVGELVLGHRAEEFWESIQTLSGIAIVVGGILALKASGREAEFRTSRPGYVHAKPEATDPDYADGLAYRA